MNSSAIKRAEQKVERSTADFEIAMEHLEKKVEQTTARVQRTVDLVKRPKRILTDFANKMRNSKPFAIEALALVGGIMIGVFFLRRRKIRSRAGGELVIQEL